MGKQERAADFRCRRYKLPPEAFAIAPEREPEPTDPVDQETWTNLTWLTDDVLLRTSDYHGDVLRNATQLVGHWIGMVLDLQGLAPNPRDDALCLACLDATDDFQASAYIMAVGYYRQSIAALRTALEAVLAGAYFRGLPDPRKFSEWAEGRREGQLWVSQIRKELRKVQPYSSFEGGGDVLLSNGGWVSLLYSRLSAFSHGRPSYVDVDGSQIPTSNVGLWGGSNGPVYEPRAVSLWSFLFFDTALLCLELLGLSEPRLPSVQEPTDIGYLAFLRRVLSWHGHPPAVAEQIARYIRLT